MSTGGPDLPIASPICAPVIRPPTNPRCWQAVLADGTNLGLARMADASRSLSYHHLVNVAQWHISDDNYLAARAAIINVASQTPDGRNLGR